MKYVLTGNEGFIASHLERYLSSKDSTLSILGVDKKSGYDLNQKKNVDSLPSCDVLLHLAASNGTRHFYEKPTEVLSNNTIPTLNLIERYKGSNTKFLFASTCEIFNGATDLGIYIIPTDEAVPVVFRDILNPRWSYSLPKALGENAVANSMKNWLIVRYFNIYGPGQSDHFIDEFVTRVKRGQYFINGDDTRSFCYVDDAVELTVHALDKFSNEIVNIGSQQEYRISEVAKLIMKHMGVNPGRLEIRGGAQGSARRRCPDMSKLIKKIDYHYKHSINEGILKTLESLK
jgi:nucleoside-diphosphate-sugar epimerase